MRMTIKSLAMAFAIVTAGFTAAAPVSAQGLSSSDVVLVRDHGNRADRYERRDRYERHHRPRYERRHHRDRFYDGRRYDRHSRHERDHRRDRRDRRDRGVVIRLN